MAAIPDTETRRLDFEYTAAGQQDLANIAQFLNAPGEPASEFALDLFEAIEHLRRWPYTGHRREDLTAHDVCFWPFSAYYLILHVQPDLLTIIAVLHQRQNIARALRKRLGPVRKHQR